jgi:hypothetical protein
MVLPRASQRGDSPLLIESIKANRKRLLLLLSLLIFIGYVGNAAPASRRLQPIAQWIPSPTALLSRPKRGVIIHPIPKLMADAQVKYKQLLNAQSKSLAQAVREYRRRYGRDPPKGFDEWWAFATENGVKITDEYDQLVTDLEPFWELSGEEVRRRAVQVLCI